MLNGLDKSKILNQLVTQLESDLVASQEAAAAARDAAVYDLQKYLKKTKTKIVDPAGEYYADYFAVYFKDPDGLKFEGMWYDG